jgi:hypothetical protein
MSEQNTGIKPKATVEFTLHVLLDDGTTKDIKCVGQVMPEQPAQTDTVRSKQEQ